MAEQAADTAHQVLHIRVMGADNLKKVDTVGWADPYCIVYANNTKIGKTKIIKKKKNPVWNAAFDTSLHYGHVDLRFEVFDWDAIGKHTFLGLVNIDANEAAAHYDKHNMKFELLPNPDKKDKYNKHVQGEIFLSFSVMLDEQARALKEPEAGEKELKAIKFESGSRIKTLQRRLSVHTDHQVLHLHVVGAQDVKKCDVVGWADPYVVSYANDTQIGKTSVQKSTKNPKWNEVYDVDLHYGHVHLKFEMFDWDRVGKHTFMGQLEIDTADILQYYGMSNVPFSLCPDPNRSTKKNKKVGGKLLLSFSVMTDEQARAATEKEHAEKLEEMKAAEEEIVKRKAAAEKLAAEKKAIEDAVVAKTVAETQKGVPGTQAPVAPSGHELDTSHQSLHIRVMGADNLKKVDTVGWADPYCIVYANNTKIGKTKIIKKKKNPVWNAAFDTSLHYGHVDLRFEVFDWDAIGKHTFLGLVNIDANEAAAHYDKHNMKFELLPDPDKKDKYNKHVQGEIFLSFSVMLDEQAETRKAGEGGDITSIDATKFEAGSRIKSLQRQLSVHTTHQVLHLHVVGAENIKKCDTIGWADPYVIVFANDTRIGKTGVIKSTKKPQWNEVYDIDLHYGHVHLRFEMYDWDRVGSHTFMGQVNIDTDDIQALYGKQNVPFELKSDRNRSEKKNKKVGGELFLSFSVMTDQKAREKTEQEEAEKAAALKAEEEKFAKLKEETERAAAEKKAKDEALKQKEADAKHAKHAFEAEQARQKAELAAKEARQAQEAFEKAQKAATSSKTETIGVGVEEVRETGVEEAMETGVEEAIGADVEEDKPSTGEADSAPTGNAATVEPTEVPAAVPLAEEDQGYPAVEDKDRPIVEINPTVASFKVPKKRPNKSSVDMAAPIFTPLSPSADGGVTAAKLKELKRFGKNQPGKQYKSSPTYLSKPMSAAELDQKLVEFKSSYTKTLKPEDSGPFQYLVEKEKKRAKTDALIPNFYSKIDQAVHTVAKSNTAIAYVAENGSPGKGAFTVNTFDDAWQALRYKYSEMERKNALLRQVIDEMSRREDYLVENAKLKKEIEKMSQERHYLIKASSELGDALREQKSKAQDILEKSAALIEEKKNSPELKDVGIQSPPVSPEKFHSPGMPSPNYRQIVRSNDISHVPVAPQAPPPPPMQVEAIVPPITAHRSEAEIAERRAQLRTNIANLREVVSISKMNNIIAGRATLSGLGQHVNRLRELRQEFNDLEAGGGGREKYSPGAQMNVPTGVARNPGDSFQENMASPMSPSKEYGVYWKNNNAMLPIQGSPAENDAYEMDFMEFYGKDEEAHRIVGRNQEPNQQKEMPRRTSDVSLKKRSMLLLEKERLMAEIEAIEQAEASDNYTEKVQETRENGIRSPTMESPRTEEDSISELPSFNPAPRHRNAKRGRRKTFSNAIAKATLSKSMF